MFITLLEQVSLIFVMDIVSENVWILLSIREGASWWIGYYTALQQVAVFANKIPSNKLITEEDELRVSLSDRVHHFYVDVFVL